MTNTEHICKNCGHSFIGNHCNHCGQKLAHRLDSKHIAHELVHVFTHTDKGIFSFIPMILLRPGTLALEYVEGRRKRYFNMFQYLILVVGIITFIMSKTNYMENVMETMNTDAVKASARVAAVQAKVSGAVNQYFNLVLFGLIPVFSFFCWLFFKKKGYNYAENFVLQAAIQAQTTTISIFLLPISLLLGKQLQGIMMVFSLLILIVCHTVANRQFFKVSTVQAFFKGLLVYTCTSLVQVMVVAIAVFILATNYKK